jgi:hypothetical protein
MAIKQFYANEEDLAESLEAIFSLLDPLFNNNTVRAACFLQFFILLSRQRQVSLQKLGILALHLFLRFQVSDPPERLDHLCEVRACARNPSLIEAIVRLLQRFSFTTTEDEVATLLSEAAVYACRSGADVLGFTTTMGVFVNEKFIGMFQSRFVSFSLGRCHYGDDEGTRDLVYKDCAVSSLHDRDA